MLLLVWQCMFIRQYVLLSEWEVGLSPVESSGYEDPLAYMCDVSWD